MEDAGGQRADVGGPNLICAGRRPGGERVAAGAGGRIPEARGQRRRADTEGGAAPFPALRSPRYADREAAPNLSRWRGIAQGKIGGSGFLTLRRGLPNGKEI